ncbi:MAG: nuclear transport factor 2 family protein [bacterium]
MNTKDPKLIALQFNEYITSRDIEGLASLMTENHTFIDTGDGVNPGKDKMVSGWKWFFEKYPDYKNTFNRIESHDNFVTMLGYASCSNEDFFNGSFLWSAKIVDDMVDEWRVYLDTPENREKLGF